MGFEGLCKNCLLYTSKPLVLTFDDGPDPAYTPCVLDLLAVNDVKATFFVLADKARLHPELIARIQQEGHHIAFHALGHKNICLLYTSRCV